MANYPQLDNTSGVWNLREVYDAVMGGYWPNANAVGLFGGGNNGAITSNVNKINITTSGNATLFGDLSVARANLASYGNFTRACFIGGEAPSLSNVIDYATYYTDGNFADFGDSTYSAQHLTATSNTIRGLTAGGETPSQSNVINYVTIDSTGNATDFGDLTQSRSTLGSMASPTRAIFTGGQTPSEVNTCDFVEIMTTGNAVDFGDLSAVKKQGSRGNAASSTRGLAGGGQTPTRVDDVDFLTIASQGNGTKFGDLTEARRALGALSNSVKAVFAGGDTPSGNSNVIDSMIINTGGTASDFGDLLLPTTKIAGNSNAHGGLNDGYMGTRPLPYTDSGDRGIFTAGIDPGFEEQFSFVKIASTGNDNLFGFWADGAPGTGNYYSASAGGNTRGIAAGGKDDPGNSKADSKYLVFSTKGNMASFGDLTVARHSSAACSNSLRTVVAGGATPSRSNVIDYFTTASLANAADFGDLNMGTSASLSSSGGNHTRGLYLGGNPSSGVLTNAIDFITFSTVGNSTDFGDLTVGRSSGAVGQISSATRSIAGGGLTPSASDVIDYVTTATTGDATDFGNLSAATGNLAACSSTTRGLFAGGDSPAVKDVIEFITIASTGNATDFGDLAKARQQFAGMSDAHGGLQGG